MKTLTEAAREAAEIYSRWDEYAAIDAQLDHGEWSRGAAGRSADHEVEELAAASGFTFDEVRDELTRIENEAATEYGYDRLAGGWIGTGGKTE